MLSCNPFKKKPEKAIAKAFDDYLYYTDITGIVPKGCPAKDSTEIIDNYINNWVRKKVIIHIAEQNIDNSKMDFSKQLEDYKSSLIMYAYEKELVRQKLDTNVTEEEIQKYYENNKNNFELKDNIVKVIYVKLPNKSAALKKLKQLYKSDETDDREKLAELCNKYAANYFIDDNTWLLFNDLLKEIPIKTYDQESYLKNNRFIEIQDSLYTYLVNIKGFKIKESVSPLSFEKDNIYSIILNKRKIDLINAMHDNAYKDAMKNKDVEIY